MKRNAEKKNNTVVVTDARQPSYTGNQSVDIIESIKKLAELKELGLINENEFETKKIELLKKL